MGPLGDDYVMRVEPHEWDQGPFQKGPFIPSTMCGYNEETVAYKPKSRLSPDTKSASILDFPASRTVEISVVYKLPSLW